VVRIVETLNAWSAVWVDVVGAVLWQSTLLVALVAVLARCLRRASPGVRYWLWQLVAVKLLLMPFWTFAVPWPVPAPWGKDALAPASEPVSPEPPGEMLPAPPGDHSTAGTEFTRWTPPNARPGDGLRWPSWLLVGWLTMVLLQIVRVIVQRRRLGGLLSEARLADADTLALVRDLAGRLGLRRVPVVVVTDFEVSPFVCGLRRPRLVLPGSLLSSLDPAQLRQVLLHELAHVRRGDLLWGWLPEIARMLWFFHPVAYWASNHIRLERELACDQIALAFSGDGAAAYAETLVRVVATTSSRLRPSQACKESSP
jgi:beta-lactamase regulating signal transducer with metallopeptidase domain